MLSTRLPRNTWYWNATWDTMGIKRSYLCTSNLIMFSSPLCPVWEWKISSTFWIRVCRWVKAGGLPDSPAWLLYITSVPSVWCHCAGSSQLVESRKRELINSNNLGTTHYSAHGQARGYCGVPHFALSWSVNYIAECESLFAELS